MGRKYADNNGRIISTYNKITPSPTSYRVLQLTVTNCDKLWQTDTTIIVGSRLKITDQVLSFRITTLQTKESQKWTNLVVNWRVLAATSAPSWIINASAWPPTFTSTAFLTLLYALELAAWPCSSISSAMFSKPVQYLKVMHLQTAYIQELVRKEGQKDWPYHWAVLGTMLK